MSEKTDFAKQPALCTAAMFKCNPVPAWLQIAVPAARAASKLLAAIIDLPARWIKDVYTGRR